MNYKKILSLTLVISIPVFAAETPEERQYKREKEAKEQSKKESEQAALLEAAAEKPVATQTVPKPYPQTHQRLKDLQAKAERLGGASKLSEDERLLLDTLMFAELGEIFGEAQGLQKEVCEFLTGWHEVGQFKGHDGVVNALATYRDRYDNQKNKLVTGGQDGAVKIWDITTQTCEYTLPIDRLPVTALVILDPMKATKDYIIAVAYGTYIKLFTVQKKAAPTLTKILTGNPSSITYLDQQIDEKNNTVLWSFGAQDNVVRYWNVATGEFVTHNFTAPLLPYGVDKPGFFSANYATRTTQCLILPTHTPTAFSNLLYLRYNKTKNESEQKLFASGDVNGTIYIWDIEHPECVIATIHGHTAKITALHLIQDRTNINKFYPKSPCECSCSECKSTYKESNGRINIISGIEHCKICKEKYEKMLQEYPETLQLISASEDGTVRLWEMSEGTKVLPALITQEKEFAENPPEGEGCGCSDEYTNPECACSCHECDSDYDSDIEEEEEKEKLNRDEPAG